MGMPPAGNWKATTTPPRLGSSFAPCVLAIRSFLMAGLPTSAKQSRAKLGDAVLVNEEMRFTNQRERSLRV